MKDTSHVFDSVMRICLVHLLSEQVHFHLYTLCNELFLYTLCNELFIEKVDYPHTKEPHSLWTWHGVW